MPVSYLIPMRAKMRMPRVRLMLVVALTLLSHALPAGAQEPIPEGPLAKASILLDREKIHSFNGKNAIWAAVDFRIAKGWHIYWQNPGDSGIPTSFSWQLPQGVKAGPIHWPVPERQEMGGLVNYGYSDRVTLPVPLLFSDDAIPEGQITVKAEWLVCKDVCIPESAELTAQLSESSSMKARQRIQSALLQVPEILPEKAHAVVNAQGVTFALRIPRPAREAEIFPITDGWFPNNKLPTIEVREGWQLLHLPPGSIAPGKTFEGVIVTQSQGKPYVKQFQAARVDALPASVPPASAAVAGLGWILLLALLGGLILNLMPCVLPVLSLKVLGLSRKADASHAVALKHGLAYTAGVLLSFLVIGGVLLALQAAGQAVGWGFQMQEPGFVLALAVIVTLVALNLFGLFELPVLFGSGGLGIAHSDTPLGSFATGVLAVTLATPCTAPFMAPALGAALSLPQFAALLVFLALGVGLALPYLLISISPPLRRLLPKPGMWMQRFKEFLAFPMLATAGWLLWVLSQQTGAEGLAVGLALLLVLALAVWGLKRNESRFWRLFWWALMLLALVATFRAPPQVMSTHAMVANSAMPAEPFSEVRIAELRATGKPVFVDATAAWCITCKVNERVALADADVQAAFKDKKITLMVANWTARDAAITQWLASFGRNGVPLYVYYPPKGEPRILPQLLTPDIVLDAIHD
jgi:thiol:disulfide interchange protein/DsbC/DsbD-like thiol-disulfide interchange protein